MTKNTTVERLPDANPYRYGLAEIWRRLKWDLTPESWRSRHRLKQYENQYVGQKAVIVCNGPSLLQTDFSLLKNIYTFGLNKINLLFDKSDFRPSCIVAVNPLVIEQNASFYNNTTIPLFINSKHTSLIKPRENIIFLHSTEQIKFAQDCSISLFHGSTVTFVAMQLAFYFGFSKVALIGCDHSFRMTGLPNEQVTTEQEDPNHFDPKYFANGVQWHLPDLLGSEVGYTMAKFHFEHNNRAIYNATEGGKLEIFLDCRLQIS